MALFQQELREVARSCCQATNGQVAVSFSDENLLRFKIKINPNHGLYHGGPFYEFTIRASDNYPISPPIVIACSYILHPNVNEYGEVYLQCLEEWSTRSFDLMFLVKSLLELFHRPNFGVISNEEVRDWTDVEFIRNVSVWKHSQQVQGGPITGEVSYTRNNSLGLGSRISLVAETGHREPHCECRNEYIVVTNSRRPPPRRPQRPRSARQTRAHQIHEDHMQASVSMIDLSDVYDSIRSIEPDYEIRSVSSEEESVLEREPTRDTSSRHSVSTTRYPSSRSGNRHLPSRLDSWFSASSTAAETSSRHSDSRLSHYRPSEQWPGLSLQSRQSSLRQGSAASRASSRRHGPQENAYENLHIPLSRNETPYLARNRNRDDSKPEFRKDINNFL